MGTLKRYDVRIRERAALLKQELARLVAVCQEKRDIRAVYVFGSIARGEIGPTSDLDVLVIRDTAERYYDRGDDLRRELCPRVRLDLLVLTDNEYRLILPTTSFGMTILRTAQLIYAA